MTQNDTPLTEVSLILMNQSKFSSFSILHEKKKRKQNKQTNERTNKTTIKHPAPRRKDRKCSLQISAKKIYSGKRINLSMQRLSVATIRHFARFCFMKQVNECLAAFFSVNRGARFLNSHLILRFFEAKIVTGSDYRLWIKDKDKDSSGRNWTHIHYLGFGKIRGKNHHKH